MMHTPQRVSAGALKGLFDKALWKPDPIKVPMQAIMAKGPTWTPQQEQHFRMLAPQVDYRAMEGVGHFLMMEQPQAFNAMVTEFLTKHGLLKSSAD
jgi:pimeloyl-ACP methyl ester carboxylesterase